MTKNRIQEQLRDWATETIEKYVELANENEYDLGFYQQTPLTSIEEDVKIVVLGINPGSGGTYSDQKKNPHWGMNEDDATFQHLLNGNKPNWNERHKWKFIQNLCKLLGVTQINDTEIVFTNATFFNTPKANQLNTSLIDKTIDYSIRLINILNPQFVLCLSAEGCFNRLKRKYQTEFKALDVFGNALKIGTLNGRIYLGIYHPAFHYTMALTEMIRTAIVIIKEHPSQSIESLKSILLKECKPYWEAYLNRPKQPNISYDIASDVREIIDQSDGLLPYIKIERESTPRDCHLIIHINEHIYAKFVVQSSTQYIYWIHSIYDKQRPYKNFSERYAYKKEISEILDCYGFNDHGYTHTLGGKKLKAYNKTSATELANMVIADINDIAAEIRVLFDNKRTK